MSRSADNYMANLVILNEYDVFGMMRELSTLAASAEINGEMSDFDQTEYQTDVWFSFIEAHNLVVFLQNAVKTFPDLIISQVYEISFAPQ